MIIAYYSLVHATMSLLGRFTVSDVIFYTALDPYTVYAIINEYHELLEQVGERADGLEYRLGDLSTMPTGPYAVLGEALSGVRIGNTMTTPMLWLCNAIRERREVGEPREVPCLPYDATGFANSAALVIGPGASACIGGISVLNSGFGSSTVTSNTMATNSAALAIGSSAGASIGGISVKSFHGAATSDLRDLETAFRHTVALYCAARDSAVPLDGTLTVPLDGTLTVPLGGTLAVIWGRGGAREVCSAATFTPFGMGRMSPEDSYTLRDARVGVHVFGGIGSGKTSGCGRMLAGAYLRVGMGGLVTAGKFERKSCGGANAAEHGRGNSLILFDENEGFNSRFHGNDDRELGCNCAALASGVPLGKTPSGVGGRGEAREVCSATTFAPFGMGRMFHPSGWPNLLPGDE